MNFLNCLFAVSVSKALAQLVFIVIAAPTKAVWHGCSLTITVGHALAVSVCKALVSLRVLCVQVFIQEVESGQKATTFLIIFGLLLNQTF